MTSHIAESPGTEIPEASPDEGEISTTVVAVGGGAEPAAPVHVFGNLVRFWYRGDRLGALRPDGAIGPDMDLGYVAESAGLYHLDTLAQSAGGRALVAHLGGDLMLLGGLSQLAGLEDGLGEGLLHEGVLALLDGLHGRGGVVVIGRRNRHRVDVFAIEHLAVVGVFLSLLGGPAAGLVEPVLVGITDRHDVFAAAGAHVAGAFSANADTGDVEFFSWRAWGADNGIPDPHPHSSH